MLSGGEPTTRNDMVEVSQVFLDRLPKLRKYGINTTGLTPHRAIPMITKVAELCHEQRRHLQHAASRSTASARCTTKCAR